MDLASLCSLIRSLMRAISHPHQNACRRYYECFSPMEDMVTKQIFNNKSIERSDVVSRFKNAEVEEKFILFVRLSYLKTVSLLALMCVVVPIVLTVLYESFSNDYSIGMLFTITISLLVVNISLHSSSSTASRKASAVSYSLLCLVALTWINAHFRSTICLFSTFFLANMFADLPLTFHFSVVWIHTISSFMINVTFMNDYFSIYALCLVASAATGLSAGIHMKNTLRVTILRSFLFAQQESRLLRLHLNRSEFDVMDAPSDSLKAVFADARINNIRSQTELPLPRLSLFHIPEHSTTDVLELSESSIGSYSAEVMGRIVRNSYDSSSSSSLRGNVDDVSIDDEMTSPTENLGVRNRSPSFPFLTPFDEDEDEDSKTSDDEVVFQTYFEQHYHRQFELMEGILLCLAFLTILRDFLLGHVPYFWTVISITILLINMLLVSDIILKRKYGHHYQCCVFCIYSSYFCMIIVPTYLNNNLSLNMSVEELFVRIIGIIIVSFNHKSPRYFNLKPMAGMVPLFMIVHMTSMYYLSYKTNHPEWKLVLISFAVHFVFVVSFYIIVSVNLLLQIYRNALGSQDSLNLLKKTVEAEMIKSIQLLVVDSTNNEEGKIREEEVLNNDAISSEDGSIITQWTFESHWRSPEEWIGDIVFIFHSLGLMARFSINDHVLRALLDDFHVGYSSHSNHFHNFEHSYNVLHFVYLLLKLGNAQQYLTDLDVLALCLAALGSHMGHPGRTNAFLITTRAPLAKEFPEHVDPLERHHCQQCLHLLNEKPSGLSLLKFLSDDGRECLNDQIAFLILHMDTRQYGPIRLKFAELSKSFDAGSRFYRRILSSMVLNVSEFGFFATPFNSCEYHFNCKMRELYQQGDEERELGLDVSIGIDRLDHVPGLSYVQFLDHIGGKIYPMLFEFLKDGCFDECKRQIKENRTCFEKKIQYSQRNAFSLLGT